MIRPDDPRIAAMVEELCEVVRNHLGSARVEFQALDIGCPDAVAYESDRGYPMTRESRPLEFTLRLSNIRLY